MTEPLLPLIVEPAELEQHLGDPHLLIVDLCKPETYAQAHVPGAVHVEYARIIAGRPPVMGLLPDEGDLSALLSALGLTPEMHVVAYDDEGGGRACRLLWTLEAAGHARLSLLNGGFHAWFNERFPVNGDVPVPAPGRYLARFDARTIANLDYVASRLKQPGVVLVDARSADEYSGRRKLTARGGHIPGAVNFDWVNAMDPNHNLRLRPAPELHHALATLGVTPDKEVIVYCQTHHRSAHTYIVLKSLGYTNVNGYPGSWSEWGNNPDTPIE